MLWGNVLGLGICLIQRYTHILKLDPVNYFVSFVPIKLQLHRAPLHRRALRHHGPVRFALRPEGPRGPSRLPEPRVSARSLQAQGYLQSLFANIKGIYLTYGKDTMICEVGMSWTKGTTCNTMLSALVSSCKHELEGHCHGVFYWEPEGYQDWSHYPKAAFDNNGKPTQALYAFSN